VAEPEDRLATARAVVTDVITATWRQLARRGEVISEEVRDAVLALMVERSPRAKFRMIAERSELLTHEAERLVDSAAVFMRHTGANNYGTFFTSHFEMITIVRRGEYDLEQVPERAPAQRILDHAQVAGREGRLVPCSRDANA
jgi:hypothetical protein